MSRDYVIINGKNSLTISGLAIKTLPPISKPLMRTMREEIDGRDGDINTELGYQAYDKPLEVGLFGNYDINEIIAFFNSKGTIVFSDEPDKFYNFEILDKIDFTKLVKFRTAMVNIHCQPFKYPTTETPIEVAYEYVEGTGESLTLDNTEASSLSLELKGNTSQTTYTGKNKFNTTLITTTGIVEKLDTGFKITCGLNGGGRTAPAWANPLEAGSYKLISNLTKSSSSADLRMQVNYTNSTVSYYQISNNVVAFGNTEKAIASIQFYFQNGTPNDEWAKLENLMIIKSTDTETPYEPYVGGIPSPNPNYPQDIEVVTGDNEITITGRNLTNQVTRNSTVSSTGYISTSASTQYLGVETKIEVQPNTTYHITFEDYTDGALWIGEWDKNENFISRTGFSTERTFTTGSNTKYIFPYLYSSVVAFTKINGKIMLEHGSIAHEWEAYQSQTYPLTLGNLEMCNIGTYEDYFEYDNEKWYKKANIGKYTLTNSETWTQGYELTNSYRYHTAGIIPNSNNNISVSNYFTNDTIGNINTIDRPALTIVNLRQFVLRIDKTIAPTSNDLRTWLGTHNTIVYYQLITETSTEITDTTLKGQLNDIKEALSYSGQTNITQTNDNKPFRISASALKKGSDTAVVNNTGNIYSKPTIELEGTGVVNIYKDGSQAFEVDLSEENNITIDTDKMEAYTNTSLANRKVTGDYSKFKIEAGENEVKFDGALTSATITNYKRWL